MTLRHKVLAVLTALLLAVGTLNPLPAKADAASDSVAAAAQWIADTWRDSPGQFFAAGTIADGIIALSAADSHPGTVTSMLHKLHEETPGYIGSPDNSPNPAGLAKVIMALDMANQDPATFLPDRNLVEELKGYVAADGANVKSFWAPYLIAIALSRVGEPVPANIIAALKHNQGPDGGFGYWAGPNFVADPDYTAVGISAMNLISLKHADRAVRATAEDSAFEAIVWSEDAANRKSDASGNYYWATYSSANSTGMLASALAEVGEDISSPVAYLVDQQAKTGVGAWASVHNGTAGNVMATTQAIMAPAGKGYGTIKSTHVAPIDFNPPSVTENFTDDQVRECLTADNVYVMVDPGEGPMYGGCATEFGTGYEALISAGFTTDSDSFIKVINGIRADYVADGKWWTYFHRAWNDETGFEDWEFSQLGVGSYEPNAGTIEAWTVSPSDVWDGVPPRWVGYAPEIAPVLAEIADQSVELGTAIVEITPTATGTEPVTITVGELPEGLTYADGKISGIPAAVTTAPVTVTVTASNTAGTDSTTFTMTVQDTTKPTVEALAALKVTEGDTVSVQVTASDHSALTYALSGSDELSIDSTGLITGTPAKVGTHTVMVTVTDAQGNATAVNFSLTVSAKPKPDPKPTPEPDPKPTPKPDPKPAPKPTFVRSAPYTLAGTHDINGRKWRTECSPYSQTERCRTEIWATTVELENGRFVRKDGWAFNNLTYLPLMERSAWKGNPLGDLAATTNGEFTSAGRQWRTECDTARTGRGGCRTYTMTTVYTATPRGAGGYTFSQSNEWVFNNMVLFPK